MVQYLSPGVYIQEVAAGPTPIAGVGTSTAGFIGMARRGPTTGRPTLVTNWGDFLRAFGGHFTLGGAFAGATHLPYAVEGFFANEGQRVYVVRVVPDDATAAQTTTSGGITTRLVLDTVLAPPAAANVVRLVSTRGLQVGSVLQLQQTRDGVTTTSADRTITALDRRTGAATLDDVVSATDVFGARWTVVRTNTETVAANGAIDTLTNIGDPVPASVELRATSAGAWGRDLVVEARHESAATSRLVEVTAGHLVTGAVDDNKVRLLSAANFYAGAWVELDRGDTKLYREVASVDGPVLTLLGPALADGDLTPQLAAPDDYTTVSTCEFSLSATADTVSERFSGLTLADVPGRYYVDRLEASTLIEPFGTAPAATHPLLFPAGLDGLTVPLDTNGSDGTAPPDAIAIRGDDLGPGQKTGLRAFEEVDEVAILAAPGLTDDAVQDALVEQCERLADRFAILDPKPGAGGLALGLPEILDQRARFDTSYAALYYPRIVVLDPIGGGPVTVPPSGHLAGIYARVDDSRGVHKAPANEVIRGCLDLEVTVTRGEQDILNPAMVNVVRNFRSDLRGLRVYGARCLTSDENFRYVNVRRLFLFLEESLDVGLQWVVFEPNDERLWARVRQSVEIFLTGVWKAGALMGVKPEEAFFVRCDRSTMGPDDLYNGRLILDIGVAPVRPAEFVVVRIGQWLGGSSAQEL
jgi:phage tail sheath protein FI